jgi:hypothetical protein
MKSLLKIVFAFFLAISIVVLFTLQLMQGSQINTIKTELGNLSTTVAGLTGQDPNITLIPTNGPLEPTTNPDGSMKVKLFYKNYGADPEVINCAADTFVLRTIPKTTMPLTDTLQLLLSTTLTDAEKNFGLDSPFEDSVYSNRFENFKLKTVTVNNGIANLTFEDPDYFSSGGSCRIGIMTSMFELTAKQFGSVDKVTFSPFDVFQP